MNKLRTFAAVALLFAAPWSLQAGEFPIVFKTDFEKGTLDGWTTTDPSAWKIEKGDGGHDNVLSLAALSKYSPKVRSPLSIALVDDVVVSDFVLDIDLKSTSKAEPHQDLCLFFNYQDPEHFYYVHLGRQADPHAHSVFLVNNEPRVSIAKDRTDGTPWTDGWHKVRIERNVSTGDIKVYFDDMTKPVIHAVDKHFTWGKVGVGSFDNTGWFDNLVLRGVKVERQPRASAR